MQRQKPQTALVRDEIVQSATRTLDIEAAGLGTLAASFEKGLSDAFVKAVETIAGITGRVIVTGVGKSGHIGSKIAATLASTGTPAFFVHPAEANHGDLGMIAEDDAILAISWSGETSELSGIIAYARRFSIPLIAITSGTASALARESTTVLALPKVAEACPHGLAPTTSTLMQLVIGDALAVALLEARGFTPDHFKTFHPGGKLGASLTHVRDLMHTGDKMPVVSPGTPMTDAVRVMSQKRFGCVCIVDESGKLAGIITDGDLARNLHRNLAALSAGDVMTRDPKTVTPETLAATATGIINDNNISALIVCDADRPVGIVHFHDLLRVGAA